MKKLLLFSMGLMAVAQLSFGQDLTLFDFDGVTPTFSDGDSFVAAANPHSDATNSSSQVGLLTHITQWSDVSCPASIDSRIYTSYSMNVFVPAVTVSGTIAVACFDANGTQLDWYQPTAISSTGAWVTITRPYTFATKIASVMVSFNRSSASLETTGDVVYFDNLVFHKTSSTSITLYNESFYASWSQWSDWSGLASSQSGKWSGGVNVSSVNDSIFIARIWNDVDHSFGLKLVPTSTDVTIAPVTNFTGFKNLTLSFETSWPWSSVENNGFFSATVAQRTISAGYRTDINNDGIVDNKDGDWVAIPTDTLNQAWSTKTVTLPASTKIVAMQFGKGTSLYTGLIANLKITGEIDNASALPMAITHNIVLYPNPTSDVLNVNGDFEKIEMLNLNGSMVLSSKINRINVSDLPHGLYVAKIYTKTGVVNQKVIKK